jgi:hypothetical protein
MAAVVAPVAEVEGHGDAAAQSAEVEAVAPVTGAKRKRVAEAEGSGGDASAAMAAVVAPIAEVEGQGDEAAGTIDVQAVAEGSGFVEAEEGGVEGAPVLVGSVEGAPALVGGVEGAPALVGGFEGAPTRAGDVAVEVDVAGGFVGAVEAVNGPGLAPYDPGYFSNMEEVVRSCVNMVCY